MGVCRVGWLAVDSARNPRPRRLAALVVTALACIGAPCLGAAEPPLSDLEARGEEVMRRFCLSCHGSPGGKPEDPLGPRLHPELWGDPDRAYANLGQLWRVSRRMDQPFAGTEAERRALAAWLSRRAQENRTPAWKAALPWAAAGALLLAAGLLWVRARRGRAGRR
jgi:mono/diheme cytochrome c family protein